MDWLRIPGVRRDRLWLYPSVAVVGLAGLIKLREGALNYFYSETHCYQSVLTNHAAQPYVNCFSVSPTGAFSDVFQADADSDLARNADLGYAMPGLWDGHGHLLQYGEFLNSVDLFGARSMDEARSRVREYLDRNPQAGSREEWLRGVGWDQMVLGQTPTAADLSADDKLKDLYIMLDRVDVHCIWVSQAVLNLLPDPISDVDGGEVVREPGMGVFCDNATRFVQSAMAKLNEVGLVGIHDAGVTPGNLELYKSLARGDDWTVRVYAMIECYERNTFCPDEVEKYVDPDGWLSIQSVKLFADGALGSWGRQSPEGYANGWYAEESLDLDQAIRGFTDGPAHGGFMRGKAGVIRRGSYADWVVLDQPLETLDIEDLRSLKVRETWVAGRIVYNRK
ncbi:putative amidohydrolase 3 protein [Eutypa lata UCREL1]|uniref:Putative amidohydrolase 3 protein n=1 Tax=Eutypa lata (strain UCR-EL1) TaxID=1287681 RepID=M7SC84_EUTLA|nr:putative amidohydrolase 3 protein [Eutypa lata UCREL1]